MEVPTPPPSNVPVALVVGARITAEQIVNPDPNVLGGAGLNPGVASSVAPRGTPAGPTEPAAGLMPNAEVAPIPGVGLPIPPTCAKTGLQPRSVARVAAISSRRTVASITDDRVTGFKREVISSTRRWTRRRHARPRCVHFASRFSPPPGLRKRRRPEIAHASWRHWRWRSALTWKKPTPRRYWPRGRSL